MVPLLLFFVVLVWQYLLQTIHCGWNSQFLSKHFEAYFFLREKELWFNKCVRNELVKLNWISLAYSPKNSHNNLDKIHRNRPQWNNNTWIWSLQRCSRCCYRWRWGRRGKLEYSNEIIKTLNKTRQDIWIGRKLYYIF